MVLEITTLSPLTHGAGTQGNEVQLRTSEYLLDEVDELGKVTSRRVAVPIVSGAALRASLREHAFGHLAEVLGLQDGSLSRDKLRLLLKGGKNDSGGQTVSLDEARRLRTLFPMLAIFGSMDGGLPIRGELHVSPVRPWVRELVDAGYLPRHVGALEVTAGGDGAAGALASTPRIAVHPDREPVHLHAIRGREEYFRHDLRTSPHLHYLEGAVQQQIEDKSAVRKGKVAKKEERREANESMPHAAQTIVAGTPMVAELRLHGATQVERECLFYAIARWIAHGAILGGMAGKGHGQCRVRCAGALVYEPARGEVAAEPGSAISIETAGSAYLAHLEQHRQAIVAELTATAPPSGKSGPSAMPVDEGAA